jgi:O-antigen ligase
LLYLARAYRKFKWRYVLPGIAVLAAAAFFFWSATPDNAPWYVKRMDFGRPSAQHRVAAWRGALEMMRDHPFGVGWNRAEEIYRNNYSPPEDGGAAITTNDYLMLGTQLGWPGLICFSAYAALCFRNRPHLVATDMRRLHLKSAESQPPHVGCYGSTGETPGGTPDETPALRCACRAGALAMLVGFWFDGGLFTLPTAAVFWILLELGAVRGGVFTGVLHEVALFAGAPSAGCATADQTKHAAGIENGLALAHISLFRGLREKLGRFCW